MSNSTEARPYLSIIIPCRNEEKYIQKTIEAVLQQVSLPRDTEIIVVDGMSIDNTRHLLTMISEQSPEIKVFDNPRRIPAAAKNIGIKMSRGRFIAFIDAHSEIIPNYLDVCLKKINQNDSWACVGGVLETGGKSFIGKAIAATMSSPFGVGNALFRYSKTEQDVDSVAFGVYKRSIFDIVGNFDEELVYAEDDELCFRIWKSGNVIRLLPEITIRYYARESYRELWIQYYRYGTGKAKVLRKHKKVPSFRAFIPPLFVISLISTFLCGLIFPPMLILEAVILFLYVVVGIPAAAMAAGSEVIKIPAIFFAFLCIHLSYGVGFLSNWVHWLASTKTR